MCVSAASAWEIGIKAAAGKLTFPVKDLARIVEEQGFDAVPITVEHAVVAAGLPWHHRDPVDRMLVAQAQVEACGS